MAIAEPAAIATAAIMSFFIVVSPLFLHGAASSAPCGLTISHYVSRNIPNLRQVDKGDFSDFSNFLSAASGYAIAGKPIARSSAFLFTQKL